MSEEAYDNTQKKVPVRHNELDISSDLICGKGASKSTATVDLMLQSSRIHACERQTTNFRKRARTNFEEQGGTGVVGREGQGGALTTKMCSQTNPTP